MARAAAPGTLRSQTPIYRSLWLRSRQGSRHHECRGPQHCPRQEILDLGQWPERPHLGHYAHRLRYIGVCGYDHGKEAGTMSVADHNIVPGKKFWTWGNGPSGRTWDTTLTDSDISESVATITARKPAP